MTESVTIPGKETMKDHVKPNGPVPSDTHPRVEHRSRKTKGPEENPTMNATGSTIPTGPRGDHRPEDIELCDRIARQMRRHNLAHRNEEGDAFCWCGLRFATLDGLYRHCARLGKHRRDEAFAGLADQHRISSGAEGLESGQQRQVVLDARLIIDSSIMTLPVFRARSY